MSEQATQAQPTGTATETATAPPRQPIPKSELPPPPRESTAGAPSLLPLGPYQVRVGKHTWGERKEVLQLVEDRTPQPLAEFQRRLDILTDVDARRALIEGHLDSAYIAQRDWPPQWYSTEFLRALFAPENLSDVLGIILRRHNGEHAVEGVRAHLKALIEGELDADPNTFAEQVEAAVARWLLGPGHLTREQLKESADPKGGGGAPLPATSPAPGSPSTATSPAS